jgi:glutathione synthase/RimK-type ligase-like ATP-grasp enzyme
LRVGVGDEVMEVQVRSKQSGKVVANVKVSKSATAAELKREFVKHCTTFRESLGLNLTVSIRCEDVV